MFKKINPFLKNNKSFSKNTKVIDFLCKSYIIVLMKNKKKHKIIHIEVRKVKNSMFFTIIHIKCCEKQDTTGQNIRKKDRLFTSIL